MAVILNFGSILKKSLAHPHFVRNVMLKIQKKSPVVFEFLRPQENLTPAAGQNPGATKIPLPLPCLRAWDKKFKSL